MKRRGFVFGGIGAAVAVGGWRAISSFMEKGATKPAVDSAISDEQRRRDAEEEVKKNGLRLEPQADTHKDALVNFPALQGYVQELKDIPAGSFRYGFFHGQSEAAPRVDVSAFRMGTTPVTWAVWKEYCRAESVSLPEEPFWGRLDNHPVIFVSYNDIVGTNGRGGFCGWASRVSGINLRLPTGVEYEYACRGGKDGFEYPWGDTFDTSYLYCRINENWITAIKTAAVDRTERIYVNGYGLTDMVGNIAEWCEKNADGKFELRGMPWVCGPDGGYFKCKFHVSVSDISNQHVEDRGFRLVAGPS